jgi:hypothetical protein
MILHKCELSGVEFDFNEEKNEANDYTVLIGHLFKEAQKIQDKHVRYIVMGFLTDMAVTEDIGY